MSAQHTPAPWLIGEDQCVDETWSIVTTSGGSIIANVNDRHDRLANARLIAAAPDMLAALKHARQNMPHPDQMIDDAITKAEVRP
jgi:hypothetical protein